MANSMPVASDTQPPISLDRQKLWSLENSLAVLATTDHLRDLRLRLYRYLCETCTHEWSDVGGWGGCPKGTHQCDWCHKVLPLAEWRALGRTAVN